MTVRSDRGGRGTSFRDERGTNVVEFALIALVFFTIVFGILDLGRALYQYNLLANSAREGARVAIIQANTTAQIQNRAVASSSGLLTTSDVTIIGTRSCSATCGLVTVTVQHTFTPVTPLISDIVGSALTLQASSTMVVER